MSSVTPFVGVWIETALARERLLEDLVTPFVGVWIETFTSGRNKKGKRCHTLRGCVD